MPVYSVWVAIIIVVTNDLTWPREILKLILHMFLVSFVAVVTAAFGHEYFKKE